MIKKKPLFYVSIKSEKWIKPIICPSSVKMHKTYFVIFSNSKSICFQYHEPLPYEKKCGKSFVSKCSSPFDKTCASPTLSAVSRKTSSTIYTCIFVGSTGDMNLSAGKSKPSCFSRSATRSCLPFAIVRSLVELGTEAKEDDAERVSK